MTTGNLAADNGTPPSQGIPGLHHITAMAGDAQRNLNFYSSVLGQRLVKTTVNFDDPGTYHLYYGDGGGGSGTILTFFPWGNGRRGRPGTGEAGAVGYTIARPSLDYWRRRLADFNVTTQPEEVRFGETVLAFTDPDGMSVELITSAHLPSIDHWADGPVPAEHTLRGFHSVTLWLARAEASAALLTDVFGYRLVDSEGNRSCYAATTSNTTDAAPGLYVDLVTYPGQGRGVLGVGSIHHVAFRVADDAAQLAWQAKLAQAGRQVTEVRDRQYFHSIYFREPGGVLYELATDPPGFLWDETRETLGSELKLPVWLEPRRNDILAVLPPLARMAQSSE